MYLTRYYTSHGPRWALAGHFLPQQLSLELLLELPKRSMIDLLSSVPATEAVAAEMLLPPLDPGHEVWACGVTYRRSREAREAESESSADVYERVYDAERPEIFFKAIGWRVVGHGMPIRVRQDSRWSVPEPELTLVINRHQEIVGFCIGNDVSSRDIEGENPLYLPQAKIYRGSCALGPGILVTEIDELRDVALEAEILRGDKVIFRDETRTSHMKRSPEELLAFLCRELDFPHGVFLMTGTGIIPQDDFTLQPGDRVRIHMAGMKLENEVI